MAKVKTVEEWEAITRQTWEIENKYAPTAMAAFDYTLEAIAAEHAPLKDSAFVVVSKTMLALYEEREQRDKERAELNK